MNVYLLCFSEGACCLLVLLLFFHPLRKNPAANRWLALFVLVMDLAFAGIFLEKTGLSVAHPLVLKGIYSLEFLLGPFLYISVLFFVNPAKTFSRPDTLHFLPFFIYASIENIVYYHSPTIITRVLFDAGNSVIIIRDLLPIQLLAYIVVSWRALGKHNKNIQLIAAATEGIDLRWLRHFLLILAVIELFWINDALFSLPVLLAITPFAYTVSVFFLGYFAVRQGAVYDFEPETIEELTEIVDPPPPDKEAAAPPRLNEVTLGELSGRLQQLMEIERLFLDNELTLPVVAAKLGITIHDASYLINQATGSNFYHFVNKYRVEEAKKLLASPTAGELNMLGIAFAAGFNSKTTFNTAFKKWTGLSPSAYLKQHQKE